MLKLGKLILKKKKYTKKTLDSKKNITSLEEELNNNKNKKQLKLINESILSK